MEVMEDGNLYPRAARCKEQVWSHILTMVSARMRESLMTPFTVQELLDAFTEKDGQKCPEEDGLSSAFFLTFWD